MADINILATGYGREFTNNIRRLSDAIESLGKKASEPEPLTRDQVALAIYTKGVEGLGLGGELSPHIRDIAVKVARGSYVLADIFIEAGKK